MFDIIESPSSPGAAVQDYSQLKPVLAFLLYPDIAENSPEFAATFLSFITGSFANTNASTSSKNTPARVTTSHNDVTMNYLIASKSGVDLSNAETFLWGVLVSPCALVHADTPSRADLNDCLRHYRKILLTAGWRVSPRGGDGDAEPPVGDLSAHKHFDLQTEEYFATLHILSVISRALILAYNSLEKEQMKHKRLVTVESSKLGALLGALQAGTKSDLANSLLEAMECSNGVLRRRYDSLEYSRSRPPSQGDSNNLMKILRKSYLRQEYIYMPGAEFFRLVSDGIPIAVDEVLAKIYFQNSTGDVSSV